MSHFATHFGGQSLAPHLESSRVRHQRYQGHSGTRKGLVLVGRPSKGKSHAIFADIRPCFVGIPAKLEMNAGHAFMPFEKWGSDEKPLQAVNLVYFGTPPPLPLSVASDNMRPCAPRGESDVLCLRAGQYDRPKWIPGFRVEPFNHERISRHGNLLCALAPPYRVRGRLLR